MEYFLLLLSSALATAKVSIQSGASRRILKSHKDVVFFNAGVFLVAFALFAFNIAEASPSVWLFAASFALFTVSFQLFYTEALSVGNVSLTVMMVNLSMIIPVLISIFFYHEPLSAFRIIGIFLTVFTIVCVTDIKGENSFNKKWLILSILAAGSNGAIGVTQKIFNSSAYASEREAFISSSYILAFCLTAVICFFLSLSKTRKANTSRSKTNPRIFIYMILEGVILAACQWINNYALYIMDGTFFFPVYSGTSIILSSLVGILVFKDKLKIKQMLGILLGVVSVVFMNF